MKPSRPRSPWALVRLDMSSTVVVRPSRRARIRPPRSATKSEASSPGRIRRSTGSVKEAIDVKRTRGRPLGTGRLELVPELELPGELGEVDGDDDAGDNDDDDEGARLAMVEGSESWDVELHDARASKEAASRSGGLHRPTQ